MKNEQYYGLTPFPWDFDLDESIHSVFAYERNLTVNFFYPFMYGAPLAQCIYVATYANINQHDGSAPLATSIYVNKTITLSGTDTWCTPSCSYNFSVFIPRYGNSDPEIYVIGHSGLTRGGWYPEFDGHYQWPGDHP
jgi:hypothetical protein